MNAACTHCAELEDRVAWLEGELGLRVDAAKLNAIREAMRARYGAGSNTGAACRLISVLHAAKGRPLTKLQMMEMLPPQAGGEDDRDPKIIDVWVCIARKGIGADAIATVWGRGYRMTEVGLARVDGITQTEGKRHDLDA